MSSTTITIFIHSCSIVFYSFTQPSLCTKKLTTTTCPVVDKQTVSLCWRFVLLHSVAEDDRKVGERRSSRRLKEPCDSKCW